MLAQGGFWCKHSRCSRGSHVQVSTIQPSCAAVILLLITTCSACAAQEVHTSEHARAERELTRQEFGKHDAPQSNMRTPNPPNGMEHTCIVCMHALALLASVMLGMWHFRWSGQGVQPKRPSSPPRAPQVQHLPGPDIASGGETRQCTGGLCSPFAASEENTEDEGQLLDSVVCPPTPAKRIRKSFSMDDIIGTAPAGLASHSHSTRISAPQLAGQSCAHPVTSSLPIRKAHSVFSSLPSTSSRSPQHWPTLASSFTLSSLLPTKPTMPLVWQEPALLQAADASCAIHSHGSNSCSLDRHMSSTNSRSNIHSLGSSADQWAALGHAPSAPACGLKAHQSVRSLFSMEVQGLLPELDSCLSDDDEEGGGPEGASQNCEGGWVGEREEPPSRSTEGGGCSEITLDWGDTPSPCAEEGSDARPCLGGSWQGVRKDQQGMKEGIWLEVASSQEAEGAAQQQLHRGVHCRVKEGQHSMPPRFNLEVGEGKDLQVNEQHLLGFGSSGCVFKGRLQLGDDAHGGVVPVAVKVLSEASLNHRQLFSGGADSMLAEFQREALILARSVHPNIVHCFGGSLRPCTDRPAFIVQELCEASLHALLYDPFMSPTIVRQLSGSSCDDSSSSRVSPRTGLGRLLPLRRALEVASDIASALVYLHPRVLHRDIKSANVLLSADGTAKLGDMGLSMVKPSSAAWHEVLESCEEGTIAYLAPECMSFSSGMAINLTEKVDVYSFGILLNELLTGTRPFFGMTTPVLRVRVALFGARPELPAAAAAGASLPEGLVPLIQACWAQEPEDRPPAADVKDALQAMLAELKD